MNGLRKRKKLKVFNFSFLFQMPQCALNQESSAPCDLKQPTEDAIPVNQQSPVDGRVTVGESSSYEETSVDSLRDQPKASVGGEVNECSNENEAASGEGRKRSTNFLCFYSF